MARIAEAELERLKSEVSVQRLAEARGVELRRHGADLVGRCPFHADKTPSLVITPSKNLWHCLGACRAGGTVIDWVMKAEGVSFLHAVELLRADAPLTHAPAPTVRKLPLPVTPNADDEAVLQQVVDYYHQRLKQTPDALEYLKSRGLESAEAVAHFKLGFADRTLGLRLPESWAPSCAAGCSSWASSATAATSTSTAASWSPSSMRAARCAGCTGGR